MKDISKSKERPDGRRALLVYMDPALFKEIKRIALDDDVTAFSLVEEAARQWLARRGNYGSSNEASR